MKDATIVFDLDGTLVDTAPDLINATNHVMKHARLQAVDSQIARPWISHGARHMITMALEHANTTLSQSEIDGLLELFLTHYAQNIARESRPFPGMLDALNVLSTKGARLAVCTNKREQLARALLDELDLSKKFQALVGRDTLPVCKPDPGHILGTIERINGSPKLAVMVGDSANDIIAARAASVPSIAVTFGYSKTPASQLGADIVISSFNDLEQAVAGLLGR